MKPHKITFYLYAEDESEAEKLQGSLYDFVTDCYQQGIYVKADKLTELLSKAKSSPFIKQFLI